MLYEELSNVAQISGLTAFIAVIIGYLLGFIVLAKAIKTKQRIIFLFFLCIIFTLSPWYPSGGGYFYWLITNELLEYETYILLGNLFLPVAIVAWLEVYMTTIRPEAKNKVVIPYILFAIAFEIYMFYFLYFAAGAPVKEIIGVFVNLDNPLDVDYKGFVLVFLGASIIVACTTGIHFSYTSMTIKDNDELKWKGRFLFIGFILFGVAAISDSIIELNAFSLIIIRLTLMFAAFFYYLGFILPKWVKKLLSIKN